MLVCLCCVVVHVGVCVVLCCCVVSLCGLWDCVGLCCCDVVVLFSVVRFGVGWCWF